MSDYLFVYGTLNPKWAPREIAPIVKRLKYIGDGFVKGRLYDLGDFPAIKLRSNSRTRVRGRIYKLPTDRKTIHSIDAYEEYFPTHPDKSLYLRKLTEVELENGKKVRSWIYEYNGRPAPSSLVKSERYEKLAA